MNPLLCFVRSGIKFFSGKLAVMDIDPFKDHQIKVKNDFEAELVPGFQKRAYLLYLVVGLEPELVCKCKIYSYQVPEVIVDRTAMCKFIQILP